MTEQTPGSPGDLAVGSYLAGYRLEERIGHGGMATVYRAYDSRLDRHVALKVLVPTLAGDEAFRQRFIRESRAAAAVDDPHIIPVFEAGEADGVLFIAMRYVRGGDVRTLLDQVGPLPAARAAEIIAQTASALDAAHARGLVHRDVKPANMLLDARQSKGRPDHVYLSDFGLSKGSVAVTGLTASGQFLGTLDYVAPEQIEGRTVDGRADLYALGCAAFELLSGAPPFHRAEGVSVMYAQLTEPPPSLSKRRPDLPPAVDRVIETALAKSPDDRYENCREFAAALTFALELGRGPAAEPAPRLRHPDTEIANMPERPARPAASRLQTTLGRTDVVSAPDRTDSHGQAQSGRRWWRSPAPVAGLCAVALLAGGGAYALAGHGHGAGRPDSAVGLTPPGCTSATAKAPTLTSVARASVTTGGKPFGVAGTHDGKFVFVSTGNGVAALSTSGGLAPTLLRTIPAANADKGAALTHDGQYLVVAGGSGAVVLNVAAMEQGNPHPVVGTLVSPHGAGAVEVQLADNDQFAFVTLQNSAEMAVLNLQKALTNGFSAADFVGFVPLGVQPVGMVGDGAWLYVASLQGKVSVISVSKAERDPATAVVASAAAGCNPAKVLLGNNGVLWVTARGSDALLAFSAARLRTDPRHALIAKVMVGEVPIGEIFVDGGRRLVIADSNLTGRTTATANLAVVSVANALAGKPALLGYVKTGLLPRELAIVPGGKTLLVTDQNSHQLQAVAVSDLP